VSRDRSRTAALPLALRGAAWARGSCLLALALASGCKGIGKDVDHPVVGAPPPRLSDQILGELGQKSDDPEIVQTALAVVESIRDGDVAARVNGRPIFVSEVLEPHRPKLMAAEQKLSDEQINKLKREIIKQELSGHIEQALALDAVRKELDQEQWDRVQAKLDEFFYQQEIPQLMKKLNVKTPREVEEIMQQSGTSMTSYRRVWADRQLAAQWVGDKLPEVKVSPTELREEYRSRVQEFTQPEQIKWQECWIPKSQLMSGDEAAQKLQAAVGDLRGGAKFDDIVQKYSSGPKAAALGHWDWMQPGSLSDEKLRTTLLDLKVDEVGPLLEDDRGYRLVKLTGRRPSRTTPFEEVQDELREAVVQRKRAAAAQKLIDELKSKAQIETLFDAAEDAL
jgi:parvulin-like peptidyl-prolyl isomerase